MKIFKCEICGKELSGKEVIFVDDKALCEHCNVLYRHCTTCVNREKCDFDTVKDNIPKTVQKRFQDPLTGSVQIVEMVNADRIKKHCSNCICAVDNGNDIPYCIKNDMQICNNYKFGV